MRYADLFARWGLKSLRVNLKFLEAEFVLAPEDEEAAWEMYVQLLTTVLTQRLESGHGDEKAALRSVYGLFPTTRDILTRRGRKAQSFTKIAVIILNQVIRPFTAKWHRLSLDGAFQKPEQCQVFRLELEKLQIELRKYAALLADLAQVEDITEIEEIS